MRRETADRSGKTEKKPERLLWSLCGECRKRLEGLGYILTESERAPIWRTCALCGRMELLRPVELYKPQPQYRKRTGAGERERAGRRQEG